MIARYRGVCAACQLPFDAGTEIKARFTYSRETGDFTRHPGQYSHKRCPKLDKATGEIIEVFQRTFDAEVPYDEALSDTLPERPVSVRRKKPQGRAGRDQLPMFEIEVDKPKNPT